MDLYPLFNSLRIAAISTVIVFFLGIAAAYYVCRAPRLVKGVLDVILTLPLVLPPTVVGYLLILVLGPKRVVGSFFFQHYGLKLLMQWYSAVFAVTAVSFPLLYRTARGAFESFDTDLADAARTLGRSGVWTFWRVRMPACRQGILAGVVLSFARALGEYGATSMLVGFIPGKTATVATQVAHLWQNRSAAAYSEKMLTVWILINVGISAAVLMTVNLLEKQKRRR